MALQEDLRGLGVWGRSSHGREAGRQSRSGEASSLEPWGDGGHLWPAPQDGAGQEGWVGGFCGLAGGEATGGVGVRAWREVMPPRGEGRASCGAAGASRPAGAAQACTETEIDVFS